MTVDELIETLEGLRDSVGGGSPVMIGANGAVHTVGVVDYPLSDREIVLMGLGSHSREMEPSEHTMLYGFEGD